MNTDAPSPSLDPYNAFAARWRAQARKKILFLPYHQIGDTPYGMNVGMLLDRSSIYRVGSEAGWYVLPSGDHYPVARGAVMPNAVIAAYCSASEARRHDMWSQNPIPASAE